MQRETSGSAPPSSTVTLPVPKQNLHFSGENLTFSNISLAKNIIKQLISISTLINATIKFPPPAVVLKQ
jgi:hypothetical protein